MEHSFCNTLKISGGFRGRKVTWIIHVETIKPDDMKFITVYILFYFLCRIQPVVVYITLKTVKRIAVRSERLSLEILINQPQTFISFVVTFACRSCEFAGENF